MEDFDRLNGIKLKALRGAWKPDRNAILRKIFRWYSKEFHTPLAEVEDLPLEDVLLHWFEVSYETLDNVERHNLAIELLETPTERAKREMEDKSADEAFFMLTSQKAKETQDKQKVRKQLADTVKGLKTSFKEMRETIFGEGSKKPVPSIAIGDAKEIVTVTFDDNLLDDNEFDALATPPIEKK